MELIGAHLPSEERESSGATPKLSVATLTGHLDWQEGARPRLWGRLVR